MESHIQDKQRLIQTHSHVLWTYQFTGYIPSVYESYLQDLINAGHMIVYMDNILVFTDTIEDHESIV